MPLNLRYYIFCAKYKLRELCSFVSSKLPEIYYIGGSDVFPPPLEGNDEEAVLNMLGTENEEMAKNSVKTRLTLETIINAEKIEPKQEDVDNKIKEMSEMY